MKRWTLFVVGSLVLALATWALFFRSSDEDRVRATVKRAAEAVKVAPGENPVMRAARVRSELIEVLATDVAANIAELPVDGGVTKGRDPLIGVVLSASQLWERAEVDVSFSRVQIDGDAAFVDLRATVNGARHGGSAERDVRRCSLRLLKRDGAFRITEITVYPRDES